MRYQTRAMTAGFNRGPREDDVGFARHLAAQAKVAIHQRDSRWIIEKRGKSIYATDTVRDIVRRLREMLDGEQ